MTIDVPQALRDDLADLYRDLHAHPELSFAEHRTAAEAARRASGLGYDVTTGIGGTGVVARLVNGDGPTVLLRADMDALPVREQTGLPYASTVRTDDGTSVMHACGHDMHVTWLIGALDLLARTRDQWSGTVLAVFQPAEESGAGAQAMVDDGLFDRFAKPDVVLGQHVGPLAADMVAVHAGPALAATDAWRVRLHGRGGHSSRPETTVDPVVMAAAITMRLQTVVSREIAGGESAVVTVGSIQAGSRHNVIPDDAELQINMRTFDPRVRDRVVGAVRRIIMAEAAASGADRDPDIEVIETFPVMTNDHAAVAKTTASLRDALGADKILDPGPMTASEDVGILATAAGAPLCYWFTGGIEPAAFWKALEQGAFERDIPSNHSPRFAPLIEPTLHTGLIALTTAARAWLD
jgi:hippurate hydrolase